MLSLCVEDASSPCVHGASWAKLVACFLSWKASLLSNTFNIIMHWCKMVFYLWNFSLKIEFYSLKGIIPKHNIGQFPLYSSSICSRYAVQYLWSYLKSCLRFSLLIGDVYLLLASINWANRYLCYSFSKDELYVW